MKKIIAVIGILVVAGIGYGIYRQTVLPRQVVVIYTPMSNKFMEGVNRIFEANHPGIRVQTVYGSTTILENRIWSEKDRPRGDVMFAGDLPTYLQLKQHRLLQPVDVAAADRVPKGMKDPDRTWIAVYQLPGVIFYNDALLTPTQTPTDWKDLVAPEWKGAILIRNPSQSGVARAFFLALIKSWGEESAFDFFKKLDAQMDGKYAATNDRLLTAIMRGEAKIGVLNEADVWMARNNMKFPFSVVYPSGGAFVTPEPIAMIAGAPHPEAARQYIDFVMDVPALEFAASKYYKRPARTDYPAEKLPQEIRVPLRKMPVNWLSIGDQGTAWLEKWRDQVRQNKSP